jgi:multidrug resistance efflux pump
MAATAVEAGPGTEALDASTFVARCLHAAHPRDLLRIGLEWLATRHRCDLAAAVFAPDGAPLAREHWQRPGRRNKSLQPVIEALLEQHARLARPHGSVLDEITTTTHLVELAVPLYDREGAPAGVVVLLGEAGAAADHALRLAHLSNDVALLNSALGVRRSSGDEAALAPEWIHAAANAARFENVQEFAFRLAHSLRTRTGCNEVTIGRVVRQRVELLAATGAETTQPRASAAQAFAQAMEECHDLDERIVAQHEPDGPRRKAPKLHEDLREQLGDACVASIPVRTSTTTLVVTCVRNDTPFHDSELERLQQTLVQLAPAIDLVERATRGMIRHASDGIRRFVTRSSLPRRITKLGVAALLALAATWFAFGVTRHEIAVRCEVLPERVQHVTAPFDGTILASDVRPNSQVPSGTVLCRFDTATLDLQHADLTAQLRTLELEVQHQVAIGDAAASRIADARRAAIEAQLDAVDHQRRHSVLVATEDSLVLRGDLSQRIGQVVPQGEPLFELAPIAHSSVRMAVEIPEEYALEVTVDQPVRFVCTARPDTLVHATVASVALSATPTQGQNAFVAEARVDDPTSMAWARPGMEGTARLDLGERPVRFVALHRLSNWLRRNFWL